MLNTFITTITKAQETFKGGKHIYYFDNGVKFMNVYMCLIHEILYTKYVEILFSNYTPIQLFKKQRI
jgi:hypothetical protein